MFSAWARWKSMAGKERQTADDTDGELTDHELLVIHGNEESTDVLSLGEVEVDGGEVVETVEHRETDISVDVRDADDKELSEDLVDGGHDSRTFPARSSL